MMRGAVMTSDGMVASFVVLLMILLWVMMHSAVVGGEVEVVKIEAKVARVLALSEWLSEVVVREGYGAGVEERFLKTAARFGVGGAETRMWKAGMKRGGESKGEDSVCIRRIVPQEGRAWVLEVCA